jgi:hypothetical protein
MTFLELSHGDLELPFGIKFLYQAYLNLCKSTKRPDNLIILFKRDFLALQSAVKQANEVNTAALRYQKQLFDKQLQEVKEEFMKALASAPSIVEVPMDIKKTK